MFGRNPSTLFKTAAGCAVLVIPLSLIAFGCSTLRITDPTRTATEEFLENVASDRAVDQLQFTVLRDRKVYVDSTYLTSATQPSDEQQYMLGAVRSKMMLNGVRIAKKKEDADIVMEIRSQGISVDHISFLLGLPQSSVGGIFTGGIAGTTPQISIIQREQQHGFASAAYIAYWADTGEVVSASGPFVGRTIRDDYWFLGYHTQPVGDIAPAEPPPVDPSTVVADEKARQDAAKKKK